MSAIPGADDLKPNPARGLPDDWKPVPLQPVQVPPPPPPPDVSVGWFELLRVWMFERIANDFLILRGGKMQDPKTTMTAIITGVAALLSLFGIVIPEAWTVPIIAIGTVLIGLFARDAKTPDDGK